MTRGDISFRISYLQKGVVIDEVCFVLFVACMNMTFQVEEKVSHDNRYRFTLFARQPVELVEKLETLNVHLKS